jgi:AcrR family transcriptional regulator
MRIREDAKQATRQRILDCARDMFERDGFDRASTRDIARAAGIATGTLFNYFATKEAIAMTLVAEALTQAREDFQKKPPPAASLEEDLFAFVAAGLRRLKPHRAYLDTVLERALSPLAHAAAYPEGEAVRADHLETVAGLLRKHGREDEPSFVTLHLYWTLLAGVLAFWSRDRSRHQENTLAILDQSLKMFTHTLEESGASSPTQKEASREP